VSPRIFVFVSRRRPLAVLAAVTVVCGLAMVPAIVTMVDHGASVTAWETAGDVERTREILAEWGPAGERAAWSQLALDVPFVLGFGLFFAGACTAVARRAAERGRQGLRQIAAVGAWLGPVAAAADLLQDLSLALILAGHVTQPWPRISALTAPFIVACIGLAATIAIVGALLTCRPSAVEATDRGAAG
jgi:hypothetical protein